MKQSFTIKVTFDDGRLSVDGIETVKRAPTLMDTLDDNPIKAAVMMHERGADLLDCETDSHCGRIITRLFHSVATLVVCHDDNDDQLEADITDRFIDAAVEQALVWYFG